MTSEPTSEREIGSAVEKPRRKVGLAALLDSWEPMDETFPEIEDLPLTPWAPQW